MPSSDAASSKFPPGFAHSYVVELLYESPPRLSRAALDDFLRQRLPHIDSFGGEGPEDPWQYGHRNHPSGATGGQMPAITAVAAGDALDRDALAAALAQTWNWPDAQAALQRATTPIYVLDQVAQLLEPATRLGLIHEVVRAMIELWPPVAIHWAPSQKLVEPAALLRALAPGPMHNPVYGALNVRLYNVENAPEETIMDTLGLAALGLPDLQCHFRGLDVDDVANLLYGYGLYLFQNGPVIESGHQVRGIAPEQIWTARTEQSLVPPDRIVLDLNPGPSHAAGKRDAGTTR